MKTQGGGLKAEYYTNMIPSLQPERTFDFPANYSGHKVYREPPFHLVEKFKEHLKSTNRPEDFEGLYWGRLEKGLEFTILSEFSVSSNKRGAGNWIPCPMCRVPSKFLEGAFVHIFAKSCIAIIGHECSASESKAKARRERDLRKKRENQENFLMSNLHTVPDLIKRLETLRPLAFEMEQSWRLFRRRAGKLQRTLREVINNGGSLVVVEQRETGRSGPKSFGTNIVTDKTEVGTIVGRYGVISNLRAVEKLDLTISRLSSLPICSNEQAALNATIDLIEEGKAANAVVFIEKARENIEATEKVILSFGQFLTAGNLRVIDRWGQHYLNSSSVKVTSKPQADGLKVTFRNGPIGNPGSEFVRLDIDASLKNWLEARGLGFGEIR